MMMDRTRTVKVIGAALVLAVILFAQTGGLNIISGVIDFSAAGHTLPTIVVANTGALPASGCKAGELAIVSGASLGQQIYENSGNGSCTWTQQSGGSGSGTPGSTLFSSTTSAGPNNNASEVSLIGTVTGSKTIAANTFTDGAILEARSQGFFSLPAVADALTLKMKCGSTVIGSASTTLGAGILANGTFRFWLTITARGTGAGGSFITNGIAEFTGAALIASEFKVLNTSAVAFDFTGSCAFDITAQWGAAQSGESITGTNAAAWFPGAPVTSVGGLTSAVPGEGNGSKVQLFTGSDPATGDCAKFDANHNITGSGTGPCNLVTSVNGATGSVTIPVLTAPVSGNWTAFNTGSMTQAPTFGSSRFTWVSQSSASNNIQGIAVALPSVPYTKTFRIWPMIKIGDFGAAGVGLADGTVGTPGKLSTCEIQSQGGFVSFGGEKWTNTTTFSAAITLSTIAAIKPVMAGTIPAWFRIADNNTDWTCDVSWDGQNWLNVWTQTRNTFLTATQLVVFSNSGGSNLQQSVVFDNYQ